MTKQAEKGLGTEHFSLAFGTDPSHCHLLVPCRLTQTPLQPVSEEPVFAHVGEDSVPLPGSASGGRGCAGLSG